MQREAATTTTNEGDFDWPRIEDALDRLAALTDRSPDEQVFAKAITEQLATATPANSVRYWSVEKDDAVVLYQSAAPHSDALDSEAPLSSHAELVRDAAQHRRIRLVLPDTEEADAEQTSNKSKFVVALVPLYSTVGSARVIELFLNTFAGSESRVRWQEVLRSFAEIAEDYFRRGELRRLRGRVELESRLDVYAREVHASLNPKRVATAVANEGRAVVRCDRLTVVDGRTGRVLAVSGLDTFSRRSDIISRLQTLARRVARQDSMIVKNHTATQRHAADQDPDVGGDTGVDARLERAWDRYAEVSPVEELAAAPCRAASDKRAVAVLIAENFSREQSDDDGHSDQDGSEEPPPASISIDRLSALLPHAALAFSNCDEAGTGLFAVLLRRVMRLFAPSRVVLTALATAILAAAVLSLFVVEMPFRVRARGELRPVNERDIFAPRDAFIVRAIAKTGEQLAAGAAVIELESPELEVERQRVNGELQSSLERLASIRALRASGSGGADRLTEGAKLAAEESELIERVKGLQEQAEIIERERDHLRVSAPIAGTLLTWDVEQLRPGRPVVRGQRLLTLADLSGEWELELRLPDERIGDLLAAMEQAEADETQGSISIQFLLATEPEKTYDAVLTEVSLTAEAYDAEPSAVKLSAAIVGDRRPPLRPGATVVARIDCGDRPLWYVWFGDFVEAVRVKLLFW
ncbi:HlyD family efflux transporter periplasmic adaptor subunit [Stratiformator vulcanicus]|uniref:HlyD family secretion protein n=1 Tax=Stratiformator vulcanicus TaxID=2527980 RepID=A0A517QXT1_9PLAN|nr:HlyD family secretion protein [Stratiformator vulcanicus]QDT36380.1 hypothetical protein Pan189_07360 [Stratiformator vulcanicus]